MTGFDSGTFIRRSPWGDLIEARCGDVSLGKDFEVTGSIWAEELQVLQAVVGRGDLVLDIGANIGYLTCFMAHLVGPNGGVVAVEPDPTLMDVLRRNVTRNGHTCVKDISIALGSENGQAELWLSEDTFGRQSLYSTNVPNASGNISVPLLTGDRFWSSILACAPVDLLKLDVEGAELEVLNSAPHLLRATQHVWIEFWPEGIGITGSDPYAVVPWDCRKNGVSGSTALTGRRSHDDRHTDGREPTTGAGGSRRR